MSATEKQRFWLITATYASVSVALVLMAVKAYAVAATGSASLLGSFIDSLTDSLASIITMLAVRYSLKPADRDHRFGHGKAESIAAVIQSAFIMGSGAFLLFFCFERVTEAEAYAVKQPDVGITVMLFSTALTAVLVFIQRYAISITQSAAIKADSLHYVSDIFMNLTVIVALVGVQFGWQNVDLVLGLMIAIFIIYGAIKIAREALDALMDKELSPDITQHIYKLVCEHQEVFGVHELRTRQSGTAYIVQLHIELADDIGLLEAHRIADEVEAIIKQHYSNADVIIHQDPASVVEKGQQMFEHESE